MRRHVHLEVTQTVVIADMREAGAYSVIGVELITSQPPPGASTGQLTGETLQR